MKNFEPKETEGVIAFPNEAGTREIRFIDSQYHMLFTVPDGENIILTYFDGEKRNLCCSYIDAYHAQIGNSVYHICEFAEKMEQSGAIYAPEHPKDGDILATYEVYQIKDTFKVDYKFWSYQIAEPHFKSSDYQRVYRAMLPLGSTLEDLFVKHNCDTRPFGKQMHAMAVSDVIVVQRKGMKKAYYVDPNGYREVPQFLKKGRKRPERGEIR